VGKGTQAQRLAAELGVPHLAPGDMFREALKADTPLGREVAVHMQRGELVPDATVLKMIQERLGRTDAAGGFVLDGFPRTVPQAVALDDLLTEREQALAAVVSLQAPAEELVQRLAARRECPVCQKAYNLVSAPPKHDEMCDDHPGTRLVRRADDAEDTIRRRLEVYSAQTAPLIEYYQAQGRLVGVNGTGDRNGVFARLKQALAGIPGDEVTRWSI
jgi:adenylate kinase